MNTQNTYDYVFDHEDNKVFVGDLVYLVRSGYLTSTPLTLVRVIDVDDAKQTVTYRNVMKKYSGGHTRAFKKIPEHYPIASLPDEWLEELLTINKCYFEEDFKEL